MGNSLGHGENGGGDKIAQVVLLVGKRCSAANGTRRRDGKADGKFGVQSLEGREGCPWGGAFAHYKTSKLAGYLDKRYKDRRACQRQRATL
jgi:hypothetical protein